MRRNLELENWLIETIGEEMMANHLGSSWERFDGEIGFYPNISMAFADSAWQHQQTKVDELQQENQRLAHGNTSFYNQAIKQNEIIDELQKRLDAVLQEIKGAARWIDEDAIDDPEFIKGGALRALKRLEQALKGDEE